MTTHSTRSCFALTHPPLWHHVPTPIPSRTVIVEFWGLNSAKPTIHSPRWFLEAQPPNRWEYRTACVSPHPGHLSHHSLTASASQPTPPRRCASVCPRCQPPWWVTRLLWCTNQDPSIILHRSRSINTSLHDLHLNRRPPSLCSTPTHHKMADMVAHT
jgi:hypothetical protein